MASDDLIELYLTRLAERGHTEATLTCYRRFLDLADRRLPFGLDQSNEDELRAYLFRREGKQLSPGSRRTYHTVLNGFYDWCETERLLKFNPMANITAPKPVRRLPRVADDHHVRWVLTQAAQPFRLWGTLAAYGNLRCVEISRLRRERVTAGEIVIECGKGDKPRVVPTHPLVWAAVKDLPSGRITDCTPSQVSIRFWKHCVSSGVRGLSMHRLRGWYATTAYAATRDVIAIARNMGHERTDTTAGYIKTTGDQARAIIAALPTFGLSAATPA